MLLIGIAFLAFLLFLRWKKHLKKIYYLFILFYGFCWIHAEDQTKIPEIEQQLNSTDGTAVIVQGEVTRIVEKETYTQLTLTDCKASLGNTKTADKANDKVDNGNKKSMSTESKHLTLLVNANQSDCVIGDIVKVTGKAKTFAQARNVGEFDGAVYYRSIGVNFKITANEVKRVSSSEHKLQQWLQSIRERIGKVYNEIAPEKEAGIYQSIVLGDKSGLDQEIRDLYQTSGIAHLLAISGLHISLVGMILYHLLRRIGLHFAPAASFGGLIVICYGIMTGLGSSSIRAIIMFLLVITAEVLGRTYDILSALSLAAVVLIFQNPYVIQNCGFWLSFGAIGGIVLVEPALVVVTRVRCLNRMVRYPIEALLVSVSIQLTTLPILLYYYYEVPPYAVLLNLIVIPLMSIVMMCTILAGLTGLFSTVCGTFCIGGAHYILMLYDWLCHAFAKLPYSTMVLGKPSLLQVILYLLMLAIAVMMALGIGEKMLIQLCNWLENAVPKKIKASKKNADETKVMSTTNLNIKKYIHIASGQMIPFIFLILALFVLTARKQDDLRIYMVDVGQGDSILIQTPDHVNYLFDGGSTDIKKVGQMRILPSLKAQAVSCLDYVVISHSDADHVNGVLELMEEMDASFSIKHLVVPKIHDPDEALCNLIEQAEKHGIEVWQVTTGASIGTNQVSVSCLHPDPDYKYESANDYSAVYLVSYRDFQIMMTGDVEEAGEKAMIEGKQLKDIDVLKVAHHGSASSSTDEFIEKVKPELAIISCGIKNRYGHPSKSTMEKLSQHKIPAYVTNECGEIIIRTDGKRMQVREMFQNINSE